MDIHSMLLDSPDEPRFTKKVVEGLAYHELKGWSQVEALETAMRGVSDTYLPGLLFEGITLAEPEEEVLASYITFGQSAVKTRTRLNMEKTNTYMVNFNFSFNGEKIKARVRLSHPRKGNRHLFDGKYIFLKNVAVDRGVNIKDGGLYLYIGKSNFVSYREQVRFIYNKFLEQDNVLVAEIHKARDKKKGSGENKIPRVPSLFAYLLAKEGFTSAVKSHFGLDVLAVSGNSYEEVFDKYHLEYDVYGSTNRKPRNLHNNYWEEPSIYLLHKKDENIDTMFTVVANFYYLYDALTTRIDLDNIEDEQTWVEMLGRFIFFKPDASATKYADISSEHLSRQVDKMLDRTSLRTLQIDGINVNNIYEVFSWLILNEKDLFNSQVTGEFSNKRFNTLRYFLQPVLYAINTLSFAMDMDNRNGKVYQGAREVQSLITSHLREGLIRSVRRNNGEVDSLQSSSANMFIAATNQMITQTKTNKLAKHNGRMPMYNADNFMHESVYFNTQFIAMNKANPAGRNGVSPFLLTDKYGNMLSRPEYALDQELLGRMLKRGTN